MALLAMMDYAKLGRATRLAEIATPFIPVIRGKEITEGEFRRMVKAAHGLD